MSALLTYTHSPDSYISMSSLVLWFNLELNNFVCISGAQQQPSCVVIVIATILQMKKMDSWHRRLNFPMYL